MRGFRITTIRGHYQADPIKKEVIAKVGPDAGLLMKFKKAGFDIDIENDVFTREGFGAYRENIDESIRSIEDLRTYRNKSLGTNPYEEIVRLMDEEGYEFILGPGGPSADGIPYGVGLYCKNYKEIAEREKQKEKEIKSKIIDRDDDDER